MPMAETGVSKQDSRSRVFGPVRYRIPPLPRQGVLRGARDCARLADRAGLAGQVEPAHMIRAIVSNIGDFASNVL